VTLSVEADSGHHLLGLYWISISCLAGAGFCRIWNDKSGQSQIFKLTVILLI